MLIGDPDERLEEPSVEFRLTYEGRLGSGVSASAKHKHDIRRVFHSQLKRLWDVHPRLIGQTARWSGKYASPLAEGERPDRTLLRRDEIDNRIKTLFDALKVPVGIQGKPTPEEDPFFVLLQDDRLITRLSVETDTLLEPTCAQAGEQDARLVVTVRLGSTATWYNVF